MSFLNNLVNEFTHQKPQQNQNYSSQQQYGGQQQYGQPYGQSGYNNNGPPQVPPPWIAEWDNQQGRWVFVNRENGQRTHENPAYGNYSNDYNNRDYGSGYPQGGSNQQQGYYVPEQQPQHKSHTGRNVALGAMAGVAGGALLMHEGEKVEERWDEDKYRVENSIDNGVQDVEDFPDDAARWTGRKVQEVEDIPEDVGNWAGRKVDEVEDIPDDVAGWAGRKVGDVERFGDGIEDSYDDGRDDRRYDDDDRY